jgi:ribonuclease G
MSSSILVINAAGRETRVALVENGHIAEFYLERKKDKGIVGNIYKGRVVRVLPGMQAAFVDIGLDKAAFLYVSDVFYDPDLSRSQFELTEGEHEEPPEAPDIAEPTEEGPSSSNETTAAPQSTVEAGEEVSQPLNPAPAASDAPPQGDTGSPSLEAVSPPSSTLGLETGDAVPDAAPPAAEVSPTPAAPSQAVSAPTDSGAREIRTESQSNREQRLRERQRPGRDDRGRGRNGDRFRPRAPAKIEDLLKIGQEVLVQISKDPIGTKGARLTSHISIPGRHLVFMPTVDHVGISRRISNERERRRLREIVDRLRPPGTGFIVRTVAENVPQEKLESDIRFLIEVWNECVRRNEKMNGPGLLHPDLDLILRATRDLFARDVEKLVVDDRDEYERILAFVSAQDSALRDRVLYHDDEEPIFDAYGIEQELGRAVQRKVWLKSGGYLVIDQAEALTAIDVNSGRYVGKKSLEETITKINIEAAKEIVYQLRLRNIGGIIICDFIDMEKASNRDKVFKTLQEALGRDKAKTNVLRISELGLVEMTRKRVRESIGRILHEDCAYCDGQGFVRTATTVGYQIFREIRREAPNYKEPVLVINCSTDVARLLQGEERQELRHLMDRYNKSIQVRAQQNYHREQYDIYGKPGPATEGRAASPPANGLQRGDGTDSSSVADENGRRPEPASAGESRGDAPRKPALATKED